jgi:hypothetical protein
MKMKMKMKKSTIVTIKYLLLLILAVLSSPATSLTVSSIGERFSIDFNGVVERHEIAGLNAIADFELTDIRNDGVSGQEWLFTVTLSNTSGGSVDASRVSVLGFNTDPGLNLSESWSTGLFDATRGNKNVPQYGKVDICFQGGTGSCAGGGGGGTGLGDTGQFDITLNFDSAVDALTLTDFVIRYQSITGVNAGTSGTGFGREVLMPVPLPVTAWLFGSALIGLVGMKRKK